MGYYSYRILGLIRSLQDVAISPPVQLWGIRIDRVITRCNNQHALTVCDNRVDMVIKKSEHQAEPWI
jgi:hypothetical protein